MATVSIQTEPDAIETQASHSTLVQSATASLLIHSLIFGCLAAIWLYPPAEEMLPALATRWNSETIKETQLDEITPVERTEVPALAGGASAAIQVTTVSPQKSIAPSIQQMRPVSMQFFAEAYSAEQLNADVELSLTDLDSLKLLAGLGNGDGQAHGDNAGGGFFGKAPPGKRVVYIVDSSASMNHPHESEAGTRFGRVKVELLRSIKGLTADQQFYIFFFNDNSIRMPANGMQLKATQQLDRYLRWIAGFRADGLTDPREALFEALRLQPDVIYFLTDGQIRKSDADDIIEANRGQVQINTVCIGEATSESLMKNLAAQNRGTYTFVP